MFEAWNILIYEIKWKYNVQCSTLCWFSIFGWVNSALVQYVWCIIYDLWWTIFLLKMLLDLFIFSYTSRCSKNINFTFCKWQYKCSCVWTLWCPQQNDWDYRGISLEVHHLFVYTKKISCAFNFLPNYMCMQLSIQFHKAFNSPKMGVVHFV